MLDQFYDLSPHEDTGDIDGHLLVFVLDGSVVADAFGNAVRQRVARLNDMSEFLVALVRDRDFPSMIEDCDELPAVFHLLRGVRKGRAAGIDDCMDFLEEFIENNRFKKKRVVL